MKATYAKLKKLDTWGVRIAGSPEELSCIKPGQEIVVETKSGLAKNEQIAEIVLRFDDAIYCKIEE